MLALGRVRGLDRQVPRCSNMLQVRAEEVSSEDRKARDRWALGIVQPARLRWQYAGSCRLGVWGCRPRYPLAEGYYSLKQPIAGVWRR
jgi:hypothetical protein